MSETIKLGDKDAAIVIRGDGQKEMFMPKDEDERGMAGYGSRTIAMLGMAMNDEECLEFLEKKFDDKILEIAKGGEIH